MKKGLYFKLDTENPVHKKIIDFFDLIPKRTKTKVLHDLIVMYWDDIKDWVDVMDNI